MHLLYARNGHSLLPIALDRLIKLGVTRPSRNGDVIKLTGPVLICIERPLERVMFWPERDANPFFHFMESLGYLAGRKDLAFYTHYLPRMADFSDDGQFLGASYGWRWRHHFGRDQLTAIIERLKVDRNDRRQVLAMWDGREDLFDQASKRDVPCNTTAYFAVNDDGELDLTVCNRSNDLVWGLLGANVVHFSFLLEYVAAHAGLPVGKMYTMTNNLHGYLKTLSFELRGLPAFQGAGCPYEMGLAFARRLALSPAEAVLLDSDLARLSTQFELPHRFESKFFREAVHPLQMSHRFYRNDDLPGALKWAGRIAAQDWALACHQWLERRIERRKLKADEVTHAKQES